MAFDGKYGTITAEKKRFHPNEPVFLFRAQDAMALVAIDAYRDEVIRRKMPQEFVNAITAHGIAIIEWQKANPDLVKMPD